MSNKIKELKDAIENSSISYTRLDDLGDELELIQLNASEIVTYEITEKDKYFVVIRNYHSEENGVIHEDEQTFESVKEVLAYID